MKRWWVGWLVGLSVMPMCWAAPDTTMTITPVAVAGTTITASDENARNNAASTAYNAHSHTDITQTGSPLNVGNGTAGNKQLCANAADTVDRCLTWNDTTNVWTMDQVSASNFNTVVTTTGTTSPIINAFMVSGGLGLIDDVAMTAGTTLPTTFGDFAARANNSATIAVPSGTATIVTLDSERWDTDTIHSTSSNTGRLTATTAGRYWIGCHLEWAAPGVQAETGAIRRVAIRLNGATTIASNDLFSSNGAFSNTVMQQTVSTHYNFAATDYVECLATQKVTSTLNIAVSGNYSPEFEMVKVP